MASEQSGEKKPSQASDLAAALSGTDDDSCPVPSSHDKLTEAHYFIHRLIDSYHEPHPFRFQLSAFLSASRSITFMLQKELAHREGFAQWYEPRRAAMRDDPDLRVLNELRVGAVHQESLVPGSTAWVGYCKYGEPRMGMGNFETPLRDSVSLLALARRHLTGYVHPHRVWIGEEFGVVRTWVLAQKPDSELVAFCISAWEKLASVVAEAHAWLGAVYTPQAKCHHEAQKQGLLLESTVFPEVGAAWEGPPTHRVSPRDDKLVLVAWPDDAADSLHVVEKPASIVGWLVSAKPVYWDQTYRSMLVYSIDGTVIGEDTGVFFDTRRAVVAPIPESEREAFGQSD